MMNYRQKKSFRISLTLILFIQLFAGNLVAQTNSISNDSIIARKDIIDLLVRLTKRNSKTESGSSLK